MTLKGDFLELTAYFHDREAINKAESLGIDPETDTERAKIFINIHQIAGLQEDVVDYNGRKIDTTSIILNSGFAATVDGDIDNIIKIITDAKADN